MKFICDTVYSIFVGTPMEYNVVRKLLTFGGKISYIDDEGILFTGLVDFVKSQLGSHYPVEVQDEVIYDHPSSIKDIDIPPDIIKFDDPSHQLRDYQIKAIKKAIWKGRGAIEIATGGGKTEVLSGVLKYLLDNGFAKQVFILVETKFLRGQMVDRLKRRGIEGVNLLSRKTLVEAPVQVATVDTVQVFLKTKSKLFLDMFFEADVIGIDECHHLQAKTWVESVSLCPARYRFGLTATLWSDPQEYSYSDFSLIGLTGIPVCHIPSIVLRRRGVLADPLVTMIHIEYPAVFQNLWQDYYASGIIEHITRNGVLVSLAKSLYDGFYKTLIFVKERRHGLSIVQCLRNAGCKNVFFVKGGEVRYEWKPSGYWETHSCSVDQLAELVNLSEQCVIVGTSVLDEGLDIPSFNALIMGTAMKKYRRTLQRVGRGMRAKEGDNSVYLFDFIDAQQEKLLEHSIYRMETYEMEEYEFSDSLESTSKRMGITLNLEEVDYVMDDKFKSKKKQRRKRVNKED